MWERTHGGFALSSAACIKGPEGKPASTGPNREEIGARRCLTKGGEMRRSRPEKRGSVRSCETAIPE